MHCMFFLKKLPLGGQEGKDNCLLSILKANKNNNLMQREGGKKAQRCAYVIYEWSPRMLAAWSGSFGIAFSYSILCASSPIKAGFGYDSIRLHPALLTWLQGIIQYLAAIFKWCYSMDQFSANRSFHNRVTSQIEQKKTDATRQIQVLAPCT